MRNTRDIFGTRRVTYYGGDNITRSMAYGTYLETNVIVVLIDWCVYGLCLPSTPACVKGIRELVTFGLEQAKEMYLAVLLAFGLHGTLGVCPSNMGCFPTSGNIAFGRTIGANSTCGDPAKTFEIFQSGTNFVDVCNASDPDRAHPVSRANDNNETTWWQAEELEDFVTLELNYTFPMRLERSTLTFRSYRPARMILEKSSDHGVTWTPYQFYDRSCNPIITPDGLFQGITERTRGIFPSDSIEAFCLDDDATPATPIEFGEVCLVF